jgi:hypothetical protein
MDRETRLAGLLDAVTDVLSRYVYFGSDAALTAVALWTALTWVFEQFDTCPCLAATSPEKRSGKTRLLEVLEFLVRCPWRVIGPSEAVLFRKIAEQAPTLLLDETDTIFGPKVPSSYEGLRALLNAGHRRGTTVPRCVGEGKAMNLVNFSVYCPKALAGIGTLPDTVLDRAIALRLQRRKPGEPVARFRHREAERETADLRLGLEEWAAETDFESARPDLPDELGDRAQDNWEPLLAIADAASGDWPVRARAAALILQDGDQERQASEGVRLLADIHTVFDALTVERMPTESLIEHLAEDEEAPWGDWYGKTISPHSIAHLLHPYGIRPQKYGEHKLTLRGYARRDFEDAWSRYLPSAEAPQAPQPEHEAQAVPLVADVPLPERAGGGNGVLFDELAWR